METVKGVRDMNRHFRIFFVCVSIVIISTVRAVENESISQPKVELLWPQGAPGAKGNKDGDKPTLTIYLPPKESACGAAVVICPGGGYTGLAMGHEGHEIAQWLSSLGVAGFMLKYRHRGTGYGHPAPLQDAQRAISTLRSRAKEWDINPNRIGIIGFSAGGHLVSTVGTHFHKGKADAKDPVDRVSCRPDFMIMLYPVISLTKSFAHRGCIRNLLGENPDRSLVESLSSEMQVTPETPPTFLVHTNEDKVVAAEHSIYFYLALRKAGVPAEMHIYNKGRHGFGLGKQSGAVSSWPVLCANWMRGLGLLDKKEKANRKEKE